MRLAISILFCIVLVGCKHSKVNTSFFPPPPPPPPNIFPTTTPPNYIPKFKNIQVNTIPHPFNVNGQLPFAVWIDGQRLPINSSESRMIVKTLDVEFKQPKSTAQIHQGEGWLYPLDIDE